MKYDEELAVYGIQKVIQLLRECQEIMPAVLEACLNEGLFTVEDCEDAAESLQKKQLELEAEAEAERKKADAERAEAQKAPNKFASLYNNRNVDPETFIEYIKSRPTQELKNYLKELEKKPQFYAQFYTESIFKVIAEVERLIEKKKGEHA